ncbi:hypothetical protein T484DRAFT_1823032 [Baffinella frigidus]|nr:hypothetical protein T484DRAFT_1823032 [Cryptophyta sp. CCMP2293]
MTREHNLRTYSLPFLAQHFLASSEPLIHPRDLALLSKGGVDERSSVVLHLSRRSCLPLEILGTLDMLVNYVEMARVSGVVISNLLKFAQQYKVMSQLVRACKERNLLIPTPKRCNNGGAKRGGYGDDEGGDSGGGGYQGATVLDAKTGAYWSIPSSMPPSPLPSFAADSCSFPLPSLADTWPRWGLRR